MVVKGLPRAQGTPSETRAGETAKGGGKKTWEEPRPPHMLLRRKKEPERVCKKKSGYFGL